MSVFRLLKEGKSLVDVTLETGLDPRAVRAIAEEYARHSGNLLLSPDDVAVLTRTIEEAGVGQLPVTAENLRETIVALVARVRGVEGENTKLRQASRQAPARPAPPVRPTQPARPTQPMPPSKGKKASAATPGPVTAADLSPTQLAAAASVIGPVKPLPVLPGDEPTSS